ncbi:hypothetical protein MQE36_05240 [Zhouia spongiae]|uniref:Uncharacterized protein n=1 Tax=Zhouia spongiae TaxID=2202721 RepID=A0ABY3YPI9_9FLAO|nr:hypothetical protein [Zhouia spongiae]UNY99750.1 hypothetical protein MQE36_05240 [Zhouia spongiae]
MKNIALEVGNLDGLFVLIFLVMFGPPVMLTLIGIILRKNKKAAKVFYILAVTYLIIGLGLCASIMIGY